MANEGDSLPMYFVSWMMHGVLQQAHYPGTSRWHIPKGYEFSLPTEAQWEYACRAGTSTHSLPNHLHSIVFPVFRNSSENYTGRKLGNSEQVHEMQVKRKAMPGLQDMPGNIWEWCLDWYVHTRRKCCRSCWSGFRNRKGKPRRQLG